LLNKKRADLRKAKKLLLGEKDREMRILRTIVLLNAAIELVLNEGAVEGDVTAQDSESSSPGQF